VEAYANVKAAHQSTGCLLQKYSNYNSDKKRQASDYGKTATQDYI